MKILVTYGSEHGGTEGLAEMIASNLRALGEEVEVARGDRVASVEPYDAVIVGGALYALRWHADARRFVLRHAKALREREVWLFSSGPLDDSAARSEIPPVPQVRGLMDHVGARGHATFGGRLEKDVRGFPAEAMAKEKAGDWRDPGQVDRWARSVEAALRGPRAPRPALRPLPAPVLPVALALVPGLVVAAIAAWLAIAAARPGSALVLALVVAAPLLYAAWAHVRRGDWAMFASLGAGVALLVASLVALGSSVPLAIAGSVAALTILVESARELRGFAQEVRAATGEAAAERDERPRPRPA